jgi:hypothetical protein
MHLGHYVGLVHRAQSNLGEAFREVGEHHVDEPDVRHDCARFARQCDRHASLVGGFVSRYVVEPDDEPDRLHRTLFDGARTGPLGLLRDLQDLYLMACESDICWTLVAQGAQGTRDPELLALVEQCAPATAAQQAWLRTRMKQAAPQALVVAS